MPHKLHVESKKKKKKSLSIYSPLTPAKELGSWINDALINTEIPCPSLGRTMLVTPALAQRESSNSVRISTKTCQQPFPQISVVWEHLVSILDCSRSDGAKWHYVAFHICRRSLRVTLPSLIIFHFKSCSPLPSPSSQCRIPAAKMERPNVMRPTRSCRNRGGKHIFLFFLHPAGHHY